MTESTSLNNRAGIDAKSTGAEVHFRSASLDAFWAGSSLGRPALGIRARNPDYRVTPTPLPHLPLKQRQLEPEYQAWANRDYRDQYVLLADATPLQHVFWAAGLGLLPVLAGGDYEIDDSGTAWVNEIPGFLDREPVSAETRFPILERLDACYRAARRALGADGGMQSQLMTDPLTVVSQLAGAEAMLMALIDRPERVKRWVTALTEVHERVFRRYYDLAGIHGSIVFFGPWTYGPAEALQCDVAVTLSPEMFREFAMPMLTRLGRGMSRTLYHLDGVEQMRFLDDLARVPNLKGIQWNPATDYGRPAAHIEALREIRRRELLLFLQCDTVEDAAFAARELGPDGLFIALRSVPENPEAGVAAVNAVAAACR